MDEIDADTAERGVELLATWIFRTGQAFNVVTSESFRKLVTFLRPAFVKFLPCPNTIATTHLERAYQKIKSMTVEKIIEQKWYSLVSDGWTGLNHIKLENVMVVTPLEKPFFLKAIDVSGEFLTGEYIYELIHEEAKKLGVDKWLSFVSDSARNMQSTWKLIIKNHSTVFAHGCGAHAQNNFLKDLILKVKPISQLKSDAITIVKFVMNHDFVLSRFRSMSSVSTSKNAPSSLVVPVDTRFATYHSCFKSILDSKVQIIQLLDDNFDDFTTKKIKDLEAVKALVDNSDFWTKLRFTTNDLMGPASIMSLFVSLIFIPFVIYSILIF